MARPRKTDEPRPLSNLLSEYLGNKELGGKHRRLERLRELWVEVSGDLSAHTKIRNLRRGVLSIEVDSGPLAYELAAFRKDELLERMKEKDPMLEITSLHFRQG